jgi:predicted RNA-binding protein with RPS1 domain
MFILFLSKLSSLFPGNKTVQDKILELEDFKNISLSFSSIHKADSEERKCKKNFERKPHLDPSLRFVFTLLNLN